MSRETLSHRTEVEATCAGGLNRSRGGFRIGGDIRRRVTEPVTFPISAMVGLASIFELALAATERQLGRYASNGICCKNHPIFRAARVILARAEGLNGDAPLQIIRPST
jgi:hypothetical protein